VQLQGFILIQCAIHACAISLWHSGYLTNSSVDSCPAQDVQKKTHTAGLMLLLRNRCCRCSSCSGKHMARAQFSQVYEAYWLDGLGTSAAAALAAVTTDVPLRAVIYLYPHAAAATASLPPTPGGPAGNQRGCCSSPDGGSCSTFCSCSLGNASSNTSRGSTA